MNAEPRRAILETVELDAFHGDAQALFGVDIALAEGETLVLVGANGAGKTTLLQALAGVLPSPSGAVLHRDTRIGGLGADTVLRRGIALVPAGRRLFRSLTVEENLALGGQARRRDGPWPLKAVYDLFPVLRERRRARPPALSAGQQQMVALGRALMSGPDVLLCDEPGLGLAPGVARDIYATLPRVTSRGTSVIVAEPDIGRALKVADRLYCLAGGRVTLFGRPRELSHADLEGACDSVTPLTRASETSR